MEVFARLMVLRLSLSRVSLVVHLVSQDLSIAGKRAGLAGERSGLFMEMIRVIKEMREATNGEYPKFAIWENVPGAFSSNKGEDFRCVLEEFARIVEPSVSVPRPSGRECKWAKAGAIAGNGWSLAWRQLDAQYWGVPQRRKRIALVADFGGQRASEILFERTSLSRHPDEGIPTWQEATGAAGNRIAGNDRVVGHQEGQAYTLKIRSGCAVGGKGALAQTEKTGTLSTLQDQTLFQAIPVLNDQGGGMMSVTYNMTGTLRASEHGHQPIVLESNQVHATVSQTGICPTLPASMGLGGGYVPMVTERKIFDARRNGDGQIVPTITGDHESRITDYTAIAVDLYNGAVTGDTAAAITCRSTAQNSGPKVIESCGIGNGQAHSSVTKEKSGTLDTMHDAQAVAIEYLKPPKKIALIVRRLTPTECERLQGYPDGWTDIGEWVDTKGKSTSQPILLGTRHSVIRLHCLSGIGFSRK